MKKIISLILISFFIFPIISFAKDNDIVVESIEFINKSENVEEISAANVDNNRVNLDLKLYDPKDYIEYNIKIKNNSNNEYIIDKSNLNSSDDYLTYEFSYNESTDVIKPNEERILKLKITYKNKVPSDKLENDSFSLDRTVKLTLVDETIIPEVIDNPPTGLINPVIFYILLIVSSLGILTLFKVNKKFKILSLFITTALFIPSYTSAVEKVDIDVNAKIVIDGKEAYFINGGDFNIKIKELAGTDTSVVGKAAEDINVLRFIQSNTEPKASDKEDKNLVSIPESKYAIYVWFDNGTLYWWSEDKSPTLNADSRTMFHNLTKLADISGVRNFDTSAITDMSIMFGSNRSLTDIKPLKNWDVSNVTAAGGMFQLCNSLTSLEGLENWDTSSFENTYGMFTGQIDDYVNVNDLTPLKNWDMSNVTDMRAMFQYDKLESLNGLENWDISSSESLHALFFGNFELSDISAIENWNTANIQSLQGLFDYTKVSDISPLYNWDISKVKNIKCIFCNNPVITEIDLSNFDFGNLTNAKNILDVTPNLNRIKTPKVYPTDINVKMNLPATFEDEDGNQYTVLDNTSPTETWITKIQ